MTDTQLADMLRGMAVEHEAKEKLAEHSEYMRGFHAGASCILLGLAAGLDPKPIRREPAATIDQLLGVD